STKPGVGVNIPQTGDTHLPPNTRFEIPQGGVPSGWPVMVDPPNGEVTATPPADAEPGTSVDIPVNVTYPDGSVDNTTTNVIGFLSVSPSPPPFSSSFLPPPFFFFPLSLLPLSSPPLLFISAYAVFGLKKNKGHECHGGTEEECQADSVFLEVGGVAGSTSTQKTK
ncbi:hypothetical protein DOS70_07025, partial [Staphylococcus felis]|uniref:YPDG domain-containing protein n=1 Tax=Staphylococcus felis TaxID=46127 RepID=UPI000E37D541